MYRPIALLKQEMTVASLTTPLLKNPNASLGEMASGIAHEINNPLAIIKASAEQLLSLKQDEDGEELLNGDVICLLALN